jgi:EAL domain-containing protein (putative c-di-GMP-specific phosphodiesterase class I)
MTDVASEVQRSLDRILRDRTLETMFQPIVDLRSGTVVGYEALTRGPAGSPLITATSLVMAAYQSDRVVEFDWAARASACRAALAADLDPGTLLFLNIEPLALDSECPAGLRGDIDAAFDRFSVILEVTERSLDRDPASLLNGVDRQRPTVAGLAVDDVGSRTVALAMMPVLSADVLKLDLSVIRGGVSPHAMEVVDASYEEAERTGAVILAEGTESEAQAEHAARLGARLGQGYLFGEPQPLDSHGARVNRLGSGIGVDQVADVATPIDALAGRVISRTDAEMVAALGRQIVHGGVELMEPALVLMLVPQADDVTAEDRHKLSELAGRGVMTAVLGPGVPDEPAPGVRGGSPSDDQLDAEWAVIALGPNAAGAVLAREVPSVEGEFEFGVTHDRGRVIAAARTLLRRLGRND